MKDGNLDQFIAEFNRLTHLADRNNETRGLIPLFHQGLPYGLAQACMNRSKWPETIHQWQAAAREENKQYTIKKNLGLARSPKDGKERKQQWKAALKNKARDHSVVAKRWKGKETAMEGSSEKQSKGQLCPHGSRRCPNQTPPHRTSGKAEKGGTMLPLRGPGAYVERLPKEGQQTTPLHQRPSGDDPTNGHHID